MKILAIDTATEACSIALWYDDQVQERFIEQPQGHGALILNMMDTLLNEHGIKLKDLDALAFGRGPGSFTGVRIAVSVAQAVGFGADLPLIPVSNLAMLAQGWYREAKAMYIIPALDARMKEIYVGYFQIINGLAQSMSEEQVTTPDNFRLSLNCQHWHGVGRGWTTYHTILKMQIGQQLIVINPEFLCHAQDALPFAIAALKTGCTVTPEQALPVYLRDKVVTSALISKK